MQDNSRTVAILAYITIIGWIVAMIMNNKQWSSLGTFHLRQALGLIICSLLTWIPFIGGFLGLAIFILWIIGLVTAINGEEKPLPFIGDLFQDTFRNI